MDLAGSLVTRYRPPGRLQKKQKKTIYNKRQNITDVLDYHAVTHIWETRHVLLIVFART